MRAVSGPQHRTIFLDFDASRARRFPLHCHRQRLRARRRRRSAWLWPDRQFAVVELDEPFDAAVNVQIFTSEISPFTCKLALAARLNRTAWCSVGAWHQCSWVFLRFAEAGLATGAVFPGFRCSRLLCFWFFFAPHFGPPRSRHLLLKLVRTGSETL